MTPRILAFCALVAILGTGCGSSPYSDDSRDPRTGRPDNKIHRRPFHLFKVELDRDAVRSGAKMLFREAPPEAAQGYHRRTQGYLTLTADGFCRTEVKVAEPVIGLGGRLSEHVYNVMLFFGAMDEGNDRAVSNRISPAPGTPDEIRLDWVGDETVVVQPFSRGKPQAYRFHFRLSGISNRQVPFPFK